MARKRYLSAGVPLAETGIGYRVVGDCIVQDPGLSNGAARLRRHKKPSKFQTLENDQTGTSINCRSRLKRVPDIEHIQGEHNAFDRVRLTHVSSSFWTSWFLGQRSSEPPTSSSNGRQTWTVSTKFSRRSGPRRVEEPVCAAVSSPRLSRSLAKRRLQFFH